jgi:hypothetical protein
MSGLSYYNLTAREDQFAKSVKQDFNQLESLYKEKSKLIPNRNYFSPKQSSTPRKTEAKRFQPKFIS